MITDGSNSLIFEKRDVDDLVRKLTQLVQNKSLRKP